MMFIFLYARLLLLHFCKCPEPFGNGVSNSWCMYVCIKDINMVMYIFSPVLRLLILHKIPCNKTVLKMNCDVLNLLKYRHV